MVLGQMLKRDPVYLQWAREVRGRDHFIIVDNGAAEPENERVSFEQIVYYADLIEADEIVLPDILRDMSGTVGLWSSYNAIIQKIPARRRLVIPQGETLEEWYRCLEIAMDMFEFATIGIPKHLERFSFGRRTAVEHILKYYGTRAWNIHLFGVWSDPITEIEQFFPKHERVVRGIDTGAAIAYASHDSLVSSSYHRSLDWEANVNGEMALANFALLREAALGV